MGDAAGQGAGRAGVSWTAGRLAAGLGAMAGLAVILTLGDPGITVDEPLDVRPGRTYLEVLAGRGARFFEAATVERVFRDNAEHPPLGRWLLGLASKAGEPLTDLGWLGGPDPYAVHAGRLAPAFAFAALVGLVTLNAARRFGRTAGVGAGLALVMMPRAFAHAHFAALDTFLCLFWTLALVRAERDLSRPRPAAAMLGAGACWGLALLTKIHAWLLPPIVLAYALIRLRTRPGRAVAAVAVWAAAGLLVFVVGWPWLWYDSLARLRGYLGTGVERATLWVQYFGRVYRDRDVPWHYPWFYFAVTVPVGLHALGLLGLAEGWRRRRVDLLPLLLVGSIGVLLALFSTSVPVYDGERLFLVAFPLWAIVIGLGFGRAWAWAGGRGWLRGCLGILLLAQGYGVVALHPFGLSYYNALVGGLPGAERLGLELTYWGDAIDPVLLDELAGRARPGQVAAVVPTLQPSQAAASTTPRLLERRVRLEDESAARRADWLLLYRRTAYWRPELFRLVRAGGIEMVARRARQGVWLSALARFRPGPPAGGPASKNRSE